MRKKLLSEDVEAVFEGRGYQLLETKYIRSQTPMCSLKTRYHMRFDRLTHAIGKMICVVKNKTLKHLDTKLAVLYGHSTVAHEPIRSVVRVVMAHRNLARQRYQKWTSPLVARIPMAFASLPL